MELELIVARYEEDLAWLRRVPASFALTVYNKSGEDPIIPPRRNAQRARLEALPNLGREAHTYLHHIVSRYDSPYDGEERGEPSGCGLADISVFCQGRPFDHAWDFHAALRQLARDPESFGQWRWLGHTIDTDTPDGALFRAWSKNLAGEGLDIAAFHHALLGGQGPLEYAFVLGGQFAVRREVVLRRPLEFWQQALAVAAAWPDAAHCFERTWDKVLSMAGPTPELMAGRRTFSLKPIPRKIVER